jgi:hypothetical protein
MAQPLMPAVLRHVRGLVAEKLSDRQILQRLATGAAGARQKRDAKASLDRREKQTAVAP